VTANAAVLCRFLEGVLGSKPTLSRVKAHIFSGENPHHVCEKMARLSYSRVKAHRLSVCAPIREGFNAVDSSIRERYDGIAADLMSRRSAPCWITKLLVPPCETRQPKFLSVSSQCVFCPFVGRGRARMLISVSLISLSLASENSGVGRYCPAPQCIRREA
jgi:hypothetical protein